jgi:hypothetical protein
MMCVHVSKRRLQPSSHVKHDNHISVVCRARAHCVAVMAFWVRGVWNMMWCTQIFAWPQKVGKCATQLDDAPASTHQLFGFVCLLMFLALHEDAETDDADTHYGVIHK